LSAHRLYTAPANAVLKGGAVSSNVEKLLIVQDRDRQISRLSRESEDLPARRKLIEAQLDAHRAALEAAEDAIRKKGLQQKEREAEIEAKRGLITKYRQQQFEVKSNDDYRSFEQRIATLEEDIRGIEDSELVLMEALEQLEAVRREKSEALHVEARQVQSELEGFNQRATQLERQRDELQAERAALVREVDPDWLARYERIFAHVGDRALVPVAHHTCGGCHMKLPPQAEHDARKLDQLTLCMYCGRMLYYIP
jgi:uncharacterized protein